MITVVRSLRIQCQNRNILHILKVIVCESLAVWYNMSINKQLSSYQVYLSFSKPANYDKISSNSVPESKYFAYFKNCSLRVAYRVI